MIRVLIIEDDFDTRFTYRKLFSLNKGRVTVDDAPSFEHAVDRFGELKYDLILCDHHTSGINSSTVWKRLKAADSLPKYFYVITGDRTVKGESGMTGVIYKTEIDRILALANIAALGNGVKI